MRLHLARFPGLRLQLRAGWYELPSHLEIGEIRRLLAILAQGLPEVLDILECDIQELPAASLGPSSLVYVRVPRGWADIPNFDERPVRLGLVQYDEDERWPETTWDEIEVKSALVAWLRIALQRPDHPLAPLGVREFPIDTLAASTSEPVEFIELAEGVLEFADRQRIARGQPDWRECVRWAVGRRLANRLRGVAPELRPTVHALIAEYGDGQPRALEHAPALAELSRVGLAIRQGGDAILTTLARAAHELHVFDILEFEGVGVPSRSVHATRTRATTRAAAVHVLDRRISVEPKDPWFVDLRQIVPAIAEFDQKLRLHLDTRERAARIAIMQQPGTGAATMVRRMLADLAAEGVLTFTAALPGRASLSFGELLLTIAAAIVSGSDAARLPLPEALLGEFRAWLAGYTLEGALRDYVSLGVGVLEHVGPRAVLEPMRRSLDLLASTSGAALRTSLDSRSSELAEYIRRMVDALQQTTRVRDLRVCVLLDGTETWSPELVDALVVGQIETLERLSCHLVFGVGLVAEHFPVGQRPSEVFDGLEYLALPEEVAEAAIRAVLERRLVLIDVFEQPEEILEWLTKYSAGYLRHAIELARRLCEMAEGGRVHVSSLAAVGRSWVEATSEGLRVDNPGLLITMMRDPRLFLGESDTPGLLERGLLIARWPDGAFVVHPLLALHTRFEHIIESGALLAGASRLHSSGHLDDVEIMYERALESLGRVYVDAYHPDIIHTRIRRAEALLELGRYEEARETLRMVAEADHPTIERALALASFAAACVAHGEVREAREAFHRSIEILTHIRGPSDPITLVTRVRSVDLDLATGDAPAAAAACRDILATFGAGLTDGARVVRISAGCKLADALTAMGMYDEAERVYRECVTWVDALDPTDTQTPEVALDVIFRLANVLAHLEHFDEARDLCRDTLSNPANLELRPARQLMMLYASLLLRVDDRAALEWSTKAWMVAVESRVVEDIIGLGIRHIQCLLANGRDGEGELVRRQVEAAIASLPAASLLAGTAREQLDAILTQFEPGC